MATPPAVAAVVALPRWQRRAVHAAVMLLTISGIGWLLATWSQGDAASAALRTAATWCLRAHGIAAYGLLVVVGTLLPLHVRLGWNRQRNRRSGGALLGVVALLAVTGLWLYYGPEPGRDTVSTLHWAIGLVLPVWLLLHRRWGLQSRRG